MDAKTTRRVDRVKRRIDEVLDALAGGDSDHAAVERLAHAREEVHRLIATFAEKLSEPDEAQNGGRFIYELPDSQREQFIHFARRALPVRLYPPGTVPPLVRMLDALRPLVAGIAGVSVYVYLALTVFALSFDRVRIFVIEMSVLGIASYLCWLIGRYFEKRLPADPQEYE